MTNTQSGGWPKFGQSEGQRRIGMAALNAAPASVNQPDNFESRVDCSAQVFVRDRLHVTRCERMEVQRRLDRNAMGHENAEGRMQNSEFENPEPRTQNPILHSELCNLHFRCHRESGF